MRAGSAHLSRPCIAMALAVLLMGAARVLAGGDHAPPAPLRSVVTEESLHLFGPNVMDSIEPIYTLDPSDAFHADGLRASTCCPMGGFVNVFSFTRFFLGNVFSTMTNEKLTEFSMELNFTTASPITLTFVVYRFNRTTSLYEPQLIVNRSVTGTGRKFYSSGLININLTPDVGGMGQTIPSFYAIGVGWNGTTSILWGRDNNPNGYPMTGCLNTIEGSWGFNSAPPPPGSTTSLPIATLFDDGVVSMQICIEDPPGACCLPGNTCALTLDAAACISQGGTFTAAGVQCNDITCPLPQARCCVGDSCSFVNEFVCEAQMGDFQPGQDCLSPFPCGDPRGACCLYEGGCADDLTQIQCAAMDGIFKGDWSVCAAVEQTCEGQGACCRPAVGCDDGTPANPMTGNRCAVEQGTFKGVGSRCADGPADPDPCDVTTTGACCMYDGACIPDIPQFECVVDLEGGTPGVWFKEQTCGQANCKEKGACCDGLNCTDIDSSGCPPCAVFDEEDEDLCIQPSGLIWYKGAPCQFQPCQSAGQVGACCVLGDCIIASEFTCIDMLDGVFSPAATNAFAACDSGGFVAEVTLDVQECLAGPGVVYTNSECVVFDPNLDVDVDLHDVALLDAAGAPLMDVLVSSSSFSGQCSAINGNEGACCVGGQCMVTSAGFCPGTFLGTGVACSSQFQCIETACCNYQGVEGCTSTTHVQCVSDPSGTPSQPGLSCSDFPDPCAPDGSCCLPAGGCEFFTQAECDLEGGIWTENQSCQDANCPAAGACCLDDGGCESLVPAACADSNGVFQGGGVSCAQANCPQPGACCMTDGSCSVMLEEDCEVNPNNVFQGEGVVCSNGLCPQPGACCQNLGQPIGFVCSVMLESQCQAANPPGQFAGELTLCINGACDIGSCCELDGSCDEIFRTSCALPAQFTNGGFCSPDTCKPRGACCLNGGASCQVLDVGACSNAMGVYQGDTTLCGGDVCTLTGCCENGVCTNRFPANCLDMGGVPGEPNQTCNTGNLCEDGACCIDFGSGFSCFTGLNLLECQAAGDNFEGSGFVGEGATCTGDPCSDLCPAVVGVGIGDFDNDGDVDLRDFNEFSQCFGPSPGAECLCIFDSNQNGVIDLMDYEAFVAEFMGP